MHARTGRWGLALLCSAIPACEFDLEFGPPWRIETPRVMGMRMEVVEPAPIWPERLEGDVAAVPIAEALPGDRVRLLPLVVDAEGRAQPPEEIDALWFQCLHGEYRHECSAEVPPCASLDWTSDSACELPRGAQEFVFPPVGARGLAERSIWIMGIVAREPGVDVEDCRRGLLEGTLALSECTLVEAPVLIGPRWALMHEAVAAGLEVEIPLEQIPYLALLQPANRPPAPAPPVWIDAETEVELEGVPLRVHRGQRVRTQGPRWRPADRQLYAFARKVPLEEGVYVFQGRAEGLGALYFASGPLRFTEVDGNSLEMQIDEHAPAGILRVVMVVGDRRTKEAERHAIDLLVQEIEVVP